MFTHELHIHYLFLYILVHFHLFIDFSTNIFIYIMQDSLFSRNELLTSSLIQVNWWLILRFLRLLKFSCLHSTSNIWKIFPMYSVVWQLKKGVQIFANIFCWVNGTFCYLDVLCSLGTVEVVPSLDSCYKIFLPILFSPFLFYCTIITLFRCLE